MKQAATTLLLFICITTIYGQDNRAVSPKVQISPQEKTTDSHWKGKRVAFLGDSITAEPREGTNTVYWEYLADLLGIEPLVYGISGHQWTGIYNQAIKLQRDSPDVDAILIFAGTNDYNHGVPLGEFFTETTRQTNHNGSTVTRKYRTPVMDDSTFCGRINRVMSYLKTHFPHQQIILLTPIHRGYAKFSDKNVQPEEYFANGEDLYLDNYVEALKKASGYWAVPLIDLHAQSGLYPMADAHGNYFRDPVTDRLHPDYRGNYRMAKTLQYQLLSLPSTFITE